MSKVKKSAVIEAERQWGIAAIRYGDNNMETVRRLSTFQTLRRQWETENGTVYHATRKRRR
jgi:hypothetical protein